MSLDVFEKKNSRKWVYNNGVLRAIETRRDHNGLQNYLTVL